MILIFLPLIALFGGVVLELTLGRILSSQAKGFLAFGCGLVAMVSVFGLLPSVMQNGAVEASLYDWDLAIQTAFRFDGLSMVFALMATVIGSAILFYCIPYMAHEDGTTRFYVLMLTFIGGLVALVSSANLLVAYICWEIIGLCSYFLVGFWYRQPTAAKGAKKVLLITHLAGYGFLIGILLLYTKSGFSSFLWTDPNVQAAFTTGIFGLLLVAAMAKSVMFPLHTWIPEAMNAPTPVSALLHSACYIKAGVYLIARMYSLANPWSPTWNTVVLIIGAVTMLVGALFALAQTDLKRLLAYSTISQLGHIITALGLGTDLGTAAAIFYCINHGLFKGTLFLCAGAVQHETGTRDMRKLGGLVKLMPATTWSWLIAAAGIIGVPLANGFVAKWLLFDAALDAGQFVIVLIAWITSIFTAVYMLKATVGVFFGEIPASLREKKMIDAAPAMKIGMGFLAGLCLIFGIVPQLLFQPVIVPALTALKFNNLVTVSWFGLHTTTAGISVTLGAGIVLLSALLGSLAFLFSRPVHRPTANVFTGGDPFPAAGEMVNAVDFTETVEQAIKPVYQAADPDPVYRWGWRSIQGAAHIAANWLLRLLENNPYLAVIALSAVTAFLVWIL